MATAATAPSVNGSASFALDCVVAAALQRPPVVRRARRPVRVRCDAGGGFGAKETSPPKHDSQVGEEAALKKDRKRPRRKSSKGKKTLRAQFVQTGARPEALREGRARERDLLEQAMAAQEDAAEEEVFSAKLAALKQEGKLELQQDKSPPATPLYEEAAGKLPASVKYGTSEAQGDGSVDSGPGQAVLLGLSVLLVIVFVLTSSGANLPILSSKRRARARSTGRMMTRTAEKERLFRAESAPAAPQVDGQAE